MKLILTQKRQLLIEHLLSHPALRRYLRASTRIADPGLIGDVSAESFETALSESVDPQRMVATALLSDDDALAQIAAAWAGEPDRIPEGPSKAAQAISPRRTPHRLGRRAPDVPARPPTTPEPLAVVELPAVVETPVEPQPVELEAALARSEHQEVRRHSEQRVCLSKRAVSQTSSKLGCAREARSTEAGLDQRGKLLYIWAHDDHVARFECRIRHQQVQHGFPYHLHLACTTVARMGAQAIVAR
jgi:hypothetical protein